MKICGYGCDKKAKFPPRKGMKKWCCMSHYNKCSSQKKLKAGILRKSGILKGRIPWNKGKTGCQIAWNKNKKGCFSNDTINKMSINSKLTIFQIEMRYPFFSKVEEIRYNPNNSEKKEIQVHCKNHDCKNSKEQEGWFIPSYTQIYERIRSLEYMGKDYSYFYCSKECKNSCNLYRKKDSELLTEYYYTASEYQTFRKFVLERDNYECQFCGEKATDVHHERPQKLEPFFALDPYFGWSCCEKCHYEKGHKGECNTRSIALRECF